MSDSRVFSFVSSVIVFFFYLKKMTGIQTAVKKKIDTHCVHVGSAGAERLSRSVKTLHS